MVNLAILIMINEIRRSYHYLDYLVKSKHRNGHGIHPPFVYELASKVLFDRKSYPDYTFIHDIRNELKAGKEILSTTNMGAGSDCFTGEKRKVSDLLSKSSLQPRYGKLLFRIANYYKPATIIEFGTSIGLSTLYLAKGAPQARIATIEGDASLCEFARSLFKKHQIGNIKAINGLFDDYLSYFEKNYPSPGLVFIDGNHSYEATLRYFDHFSERIENGFLIIDDINWSAGMHRAWNEIRNDRRAIVTIDLFSMGIVIIRKMITPGHFKIRF